MRGAHAQSPLALEAARLLGDAVRVGRHQRRWTVAELAERVGVTEATMLKVERGDPSVRLGIALEAAALTGVPLFDEDRARRQLEKERLDDRLSLLPKRMRSAREVDDDF